MTTKADFTEQEWETILEAPPAAGLVVSTAQRGGTFRESFSMAKAYTEARQQHGESELLDEVASTKPKVDRTRHSSAEELEQHNLGIVREAVALVEAKASPEELADYRGFIVALVERVAAAKDEGEGDATSEAERAAIAEVAEAAGAGPPAA
jgi:hypothetical protein